MDEQTGFDPKRRLCPDGTCTGIIGRDGRCGECGRAAGGGAGGNGSGPGTEAVTAQIDLGEQGGHESSDPASPTSAVAMPAAPRGAGVSDFDPNRRLCVDGACVGVVGPDGACTVCGRVAG